MCLWPSSTSLSLLLSNLLLPYLSCSSNSKQLYPFSFSKPTSPANPFPDLPPLESPDSRIMTQHQETEVFKTVFWINTFEGKGVKRNLVRKDAHKGQVKWRSMTHLRESSRLESGTSFLFRPGMLVFYLKAIQGWSKSKFSFNWINNFTCQRIASNFV